MNFISLEDAFEAHEAIILRYGGMPGLRDAGLLISALEMPKAGAFGQYLHPTIFDKAAAYLYHICLNHPFYDGNKRTAVSIAISFLKRNGVKMSYELEKLEELIVDTAQNKVSKEQIASFLESLCESSSLTHDG